MKEFINTDRYGKLYYDKILFEAHYPIIFSCKNEYGEIFIGVCCQYNEQAHRWLLGKTEPVNIVSVLRDEITIRQLLTEYCSKRMSVVNINGEYVTEYYNDDWEKDSIYLPKKDSYMWAEPGEFDEEIEYFLSIKNNLNYEPDSYINILEKNEVIYKDKVSIADEGLQVRYAEELTIPSEIVNTLNVFGILDNHMLISTHDLQYGQKDIFKTIKVDNINEKISVKLNETNSNLVYAA